MSLSSRLDPHFEQGDIPYFVFVGEPHFGQKLKSGAIVVPHLKQYSIFPPLGAGTYGPFLRL